MTAPEPCKYCYNAHHKQIARWYSCSEHNIYINCDCECIDGWDACKMSHKTIPILNFMSLTPGESVVCAMCVCIVEYLGFPRKHCNFEMFINLHTNTVKMFSAVGSILILEFKFYKFCWSLKMVWNSFGFKANREKNITDHLLNSYISMEFAHRKWKMPFFVCTNSQMQKVNRTIPAAIIVEMSSIIWHVRANSISLHFAQAHVGRLNSMFEITLRSQSASKYVHFQTIHMCN